MVIGILGKDPFGNAFEPLQNRLVRDRRVVIRRFDGLDAFADAEGHLPSRHPRFERIQNCHVLFLCRSETEHLAALLRPLRKHSVLTVADAPGFLEAGGIVNVVVSDASPKLSGQKSYDQARAIGLGEDALAFACTILKPGGNMVIKSFQGELFGELLAETRKHFYSVRGYRTKASRKGSAETYIIAKKIKTTRHAAE